MVSVSRQLCEKEFYLRSFRHRTIVLHLCATYAVSDVEEVTAELTANGAMLTVIANRFPSGTRTVPLEAGELGTAGCGLVGLSATLLRDGFACVRRDRRLDPAKAIRRSVDLACRLGAEKLVVVDPRGGLRTSSFVTSRALAHLCQEGRASGGWQVEELRALLAAVRGGVDSVNLTTAEELACELFSYEGAGTLVTASEYCLVEPLRLRDFPSALRMIERGERGGFLLPRSNPQRLRLLLCGYGAWFAGGRLAGVAGLETEGYRREHLAEIQGLYTITRFEGEGVAGCVVRALERAARSHACRALFACTSSPRAAAFFGRQGFAEVDPQDLPKRKWKDRVGQLPLVFWRDL